MATTTPPLRKTDSAAVTNHTARDQPCRQPITTQLCRKAFLITGYPFLLAAKSEQRRRGPKAAHATQSDSNTTQKVKHSIP